MYIVNTLKSLWIQLYFNFYTRLQWDVEMGFSSTNVEYSSAKKYWNTGTIRIKKKTQYNLNVNQKKRKARSALTNSHINRKWDQVPPEVLASGGVWRTLIMKLWHFIESGVNHHKLNQTVLQLRVQILRTKKDISGKHFLLNLGNQNIKQYNFSDYPYL